MEENFFRKWSPQMSYILGFFVADGNLSLNKRGGCYISFQSKDKQIIVDIKNAIGCKNKISKRINKTANRALNTKGSHVVFKNGSFSRLQFSTKDALKIYNFMYNTSIPLCLKRKKGQFDKYVKDMRL